MNILKKLKFHKLNHNTTTYTIPIEYFIKLINNKNNLLFEDLSGDIQRNIDSQHLQDLIQFQEKYYKNNGYFSFPTSLTLCRLNDKLSLLDGQHRYEAIKYLYNKYNINFDLLVSIIKMKKIDEYDQHFIAINKNKPVQLYNNIDDWKNIIKKIEKYFINRWKIYVKNTNNPIIPHINLDNMVKYIDDNNIISNTNITYEKFIEEIENLNNFYRLYWKQYIKDKNYIKNIDVYINKCFVKNVDDPLYLSIYKNFEWIDRIAYKIIENVDYNNMEHISSNYRVNIPKKMRTNLWKQYFDNSLIGKCQVCSEEISYDVFQCGHIKSVFYGGKNEYNNLRPICCICNNDMGIKNMDEYKKNMCIS